MNNTLGWFNHNLAGPIGSVIGAILIFIFGWIVAMIGGALIRNVLAKVNLNQRINSSTGKQHDIENIISKVVFWFIFIIAISGALNQLNLDSISTPFANMVNQVLSFIPNFIAAVAIGVVGWVVATVARTAISTALSKTTMDERLSAEAGIQPLSSTISDVVYWFVLLIFLPMILGQLRLTGLLEPVSGMVSKMLDFIPNMVIAVVIFGVGYVIAKILRSIVTNLVSTLNIQSVANKAGVSNDTSIANIAGTLVFLVVIISSLIASLDALKIEVISRPATNMLNQIMQAIPNIIAAAAILGIAYYVIKFVANIVANLLVNTGINELPNKVGVQDILGEKRVSDLVGMLLVFFTMLFASIEASNRLGFNRVSDLISLFITFSADILLGAVILFIGFWLANLIAGMVERSEKGSQFLANIVRVLIMGLVLAMGLKAMGIADSIVNLAFGLTLGAVAVAFALSFGLGGQEAAARLLRNMQDKAEREANKINNASESTHITQSNDITQGNDNVQGINTTSTTFHQTSSFNSEDLK